MIKREDIQLGRLLGKGAFGTVYCGTYQKGTFAVKELSISEEAFRREVDILKKLSHKHIISLVAYSPSADNVLIIMELMDASLRKLMTEKRTTSSWWTEEELIEYICQISQGLEYLHLNNVAHRDIKVS
jgi:calcium-dependent protein kinase